MSGELVIPIRLDPSKVVEGLHKVGSAGKEAGDKVHGGMKHGQEGAESLLEAMVNVESGKKALETIEKVGEAVGDSMKEAAARVKSLADEFIRTQSAMRQIAAMTGHEDTNRYTLEQIQQAAASNVSPETWIASRKGFLGQGGAFVGKGPGAKISEAGAERVQAAVAEFEAGRGIEPGALSAVGGSMLTQAKGPLDEKTLLAELGKVAGTLKGAGPDLSENLANLKRAEAGGFSPVAGAQTLATFQAIAPGRSGRTLDTTMSGLEQALQAGTLGARQGVKPGMEPREQLKALTGYLEGTLKQGGEGRLEGAIGDITKNPAMSRTLERLAKMGVQRGFTDVEARTAGISDTAIEDQIAKARETGEGKARHASARLAAATAKIGEEHADARTLQKEAEAGLEERDLLREDSAQFVTRKALMQVPGYQTFRGLPDPRQQLIDEESERISRGRAGLPRQGLLESTYHALTPYGKSPAPSEERVKDALSGELLDHTKKQTGLLEQIVRQASQAAGGRPITAPPPSPHTR